MGIAQSFSQNSAMRFARLGVLSSVGAVSPMIVLAVDRLLLTPRLNSVLTDSQFAAFIWLSGVAMLVGNTMGNGIGMVLLRELAKADKVARAKLICGALNVTGAGAIVMLAIVATVCICFAPNEVKANAPSLMVPLFAAAFIRALNNVPVSVLRLNRMFVTLLLLNCIEALVLGSYFVLDTKTLWIIGALYLGSCAFPFLMGLNRTRTSWEGGGWGQANFAVDFITASAVALCENSQVFYPRIAIGWYLPIVEVSVLYAGTSVGNLFMVPVNLVGVSVLSLLVGDSGFALRGLRGPLYLAGCFVIGIVVAVASYVFGLGLVKLIYPDKWAENVAFYHWIAVANASTSMMVLIRPIAIRYGSLRGVARTSLATACIQIVAVAIAVPLWGVTGAAVSLALSATVGTVWWVTTFVLILKNSARSPLTA